MKSAHFQLIKMKFGLENEAYCMTSEQIISAERKKERLIKVYSSLLDEIEEKTFILGNLQFRLKSEGANQALKGSNSVCKVGFSSMPDSGAPKLKA